MRKQAGIAGILLLIVSASVFMIARGFPAFRVRGVELPGPAFFPNLIAFGMAVCGIAELAIALFGRGKSSTSNQLESRGMAGYVDMAFIIGLVLAFILLLPHLGFILVTFLLAFLIMIRLRTPVLKSIAVSSIISVGLALLFARFLMVPLPRGLIPLW